MPRKLSTFALPLLLLASCATAPNDMDSPAAGTVQLGNEMAAKGEFSAAESFYTKALQTDPSNILALKGLSSMQEKFGNSESAEKGYRDILVRRPKDAEAMKGLGRLALTQGRPQEAQDWFEKALDRNGDDIKAMTDLAVALRAQEKKEEALKWLERATKKAPDNLAALNNLAYAMIEDGNYADAIKKLEPRATDPKAPPALRQNLALAYGLSGQEADAERLAKRDLTAKEIKTNLAYYKRRREEAIALQPPYAVLGPYATRVLAEMGQNEAEKALEEKGQKAALEINTYLTDGTPKFEVKLHPEDKATAQTICESLKPTPCQPRSGD